MLKKLLRVRRSLVGGVHESAEKPHIKESETLEMCRKCYSFRYQDEWHFERPDYLLNRDIDERVSVRFSQCPACVEEALATYDMEYV